MFVIDLLNEFHEGKSYMAFIAKDVSQIQMKFSLNEHNLCHKSLLYSQLNKHSIEQNTSLTFLNIGKLKE